MVRTKISEGRKKLFLAFFVFSLISLSFVSAQETINEQIPSFQFNKAFDLKRACFDNGFFCGSSFVCNVTLFYPDGALLIDNQLMTDQGSFRNISVTQDQNDQLGFIKAIQSCSNVTLAGPDTFLVAITGDGKPFQKFPQQFFLILFAVSITLLGFLSDRLRILKHAGAMFTMVLGVLTLYPGYSFLNYSTLSGQTLGMILIALGFYFLVEDSFSRNKQQENYDAESVYVEEED